MLTIKKIYNPAVVVTALIPVLALFLYSTSSIKSAASHVVISEIQIIGTSADDEFVELYNPTDTEVVMDGWRLTRRTAAGGDTNESNLVSSLSGTIPPHSYFLIAQSDTTYDGPVAYDFLYSAQSNAIAANNTVILYSDAGITPVDMVGMGTATDTETLAAEVPATDGSIERSPVDEDTDNNSVDFIVREVSDPQNSSFTPSPTPTVTPSPTPEQTQTPSPTSTPEPTETPASTETPVPTVSPTQTPVPTQTPSPVTRKLVGFFPLGSSPTVCYLEYKILNFRAFKFSFPRLTCVKI